MFRIVPVGKGYVPSPPNEMYSVLVEAHRIYTAIHFFQKCLSFFPIILPSHLTIQLYSDNQGIVDHLNQPMLTIYPNDTIQDDYPIVTTIQTICTSLEPIKVSIQHVKRHQDQSKLKQLLTILETLNLDCNL